MQQTGIVAPSGGCQPRAEWGDTRTGTRTVTEKAQPRFRIDFLSLVSQMTVLAQVSSWGWPPGQHLRASRHQRSVGNNRPGCRYLHVLTQKAKNIKIMANGKLSTSVKSAEVSIASRIASELAPSTWILRCSEVSCSALLTAGGGGQKIPASFTSCWTDATHDGGRL